PTAKIANTLTNPLTPADRQTWVVARASRDLLLLVVIPCTAPDKLRALSRAASRVPAPFAEIRRFRPLVSGPKFPVPGEIFLGLFEESFRGELRHSPQSNQKG